MNALLQRVREASVCVDEECIAAIEFGLLVFVGVFPQDSPAVAQKLADRTLDFRIFADSSKAMNRSVVEVDGEVLVVPQFTLTADTRRGRRPSFASAAPPDHARALFDVFVERVRERVGRVASGRFGADMQVALINDGPVTFLLS